MSDAKITRDVYKQYAHKIATVLDNEEFYEQFKKRVDSGASSFKLGKKRLIQDISIDWIDTIEEILPNLDTIVRNPRRFIVQEEDIVDVSLARSISTESVKFLAQHTNMISKVEDDGSVIPSKILNITKEESFEIYENRFIYTLLLKLKDFVTMRYDKIKKASATQDVLELDVESRFNLPSKKITFRTEYFAQLSFDEVMRLDPDTLTKIERVAKIDRIITDFLSSSFAKSMRNSAPVRPPIMRTNVILKEPNFKKALLLWQFIETYNQTAGFSTSDEVEELTLEDDSVENLRRMVTLNTMLFESMYEEYETDMDMEDKQFADFLRVGQMDFEKDLLDRDEYAQKLEQKKENDEEEENVEEVRPEETPDTEHELPPEQPEEPQGDQSDQEKDVERIVEVERFKEMAPKADQEEVDLEPDAVKFDQHLFEVRKLYKRPDDDKLKQEDIAKVRDAIDRCLTSYRRIKQEELDQLEREDRIRRRKEDMAKRALAFDKMREELAKSVDNMESTDIYFGIDPFSYQKAKLAQEKLEQERLEQLKLNKEEKLELEGDKENIAKEIEEMEAARAAEAEQYGEEATYAPETAAPIPEYNQPAAEEDLPEKRGLRLAEDNGEIDPWAAKQEEAQAPKEEKPKKEIAKVDEDKVKVGGITFKDGSGIYDPLTEGSADNYSNKAEKRKEVDEGDATEQPESKPEAPKRKLRKKKQPQSAENAAETAPAESEVAEPVAQEPEQPVKPTPAKKKPKNITKVDEDKVKVGGITFKDGSGIYDPLTEGSADNYSNKAEKRKEVDEDDATVQQPEPKPETPKSKPRKKKQPQSANVAETQIPDEQISADNDGGESIPQEAEQPVKPEPAKKKPKNIAKVNEDKVKVGGITFRDDDGLYDPFEEGSATRGLGNMAESSSDRGDDDEQGASASEQPQDEAQTPTEREIPQQEAPAVSETPSESEPQAEQALTESAPEEIAPEKDEVFENGVTDDEESETPAENTSEPADEDAPATDVPADEETASDISETPTESETLEDMDETLAAEPAEEAETPVENSDEASDAEPSEGITTSEEGQSPATDAPAEEISEEETPVEETSEEEVPREEPETTDSPAYSTQTEEAPAEEVTVDDAPATETPVDDASAEETPNNEVRDENESTMEAPDKETPDDAPAEETHDEDIPVENSDSQEGETDNAERPKSDGDNK